MTSVIWLVQLVHYPSFRFIDPQKFVAFEHFHSARISLIVTPLMVLELAASAMILFFQRTPGSALNFGSVILIWMATLFLSVPSHQKLLSNGYNLDVINHLIQTNWVRTIIWSLRSAAFVWLFKVRLS